ncbi:hypothetical protein F3J20_00730 [Paraburkholderia sp. Cy-641]|uniref:hypothetical protein n=1 Tax=Paraburkholderia sp. Cy-641 TaxID=2608337 RepID=UPI001423C5D8|nr:hypothetical protein [Paraburkholderia sp. Cy-641]NIF75942.1 hypothetical protein [Paraburkholderia sp. Cy-641]
MAQFRTLIKAPVPSPLGSAESSALTRSAATPVPTDRFNGPLPENPASVLGKRKTGGSSSKAILEEAIDRRLANEGFAGTEAMSKRRRNRGLVRVESENRRNEQEVGKQIRIAWSKLSPTGRMEFFSKMRENFLKHILDGERAGAMKELTQLAGPFVANSPLPPRQKQKEVARLLNTMAKQNAYLDDKDALDVSLALAEIGAQHLEPDNLQALHDAIFAEWPREANVAPLVERMIDDLPLTTVPISNFDELVRNADDIAQPERGKLYSKLYGAMRHIPEEDLDDAYEVYLNHTSDLPHGELRQLVADMRTQAGQWSHEESQSDALNLLSDLEGVLKKASNPR